MPQDDHKEAVKACSEGMSKQKSAAQILMYTSSALKDDPLYVKALQRRATSNEALNTWTSLAAAQEGALIC
jgi:hypothetical protein